MAAGTTLQDIKERFSELEFSTVTEGRRPDAGARGATGGFKLQLAVADNRFTLTLFLGGGVGADRIIAKEFTGPLDRGVKPFVLGPSSVTYLEAAGFQALMPEGLKGFMSSAPAAAVASTWASPRAPSAGSTGSGSTGKPVLTRLGSAGKGTLTPLPSGMSTPREPSSGPTPPLLRAGLSGSARQILESTPPPGTTSPRGIEMGSPMRRAPSDKTVGGVSPGVAARMDALAAAAAPKKVVPGTMGTSAFLTYGALAQQCRMVEDVYVAGVLKTIKDNPSYAGIFGFSADDTPEEKLTKIRVYFWSNVFKQMLKKDILGDSKLADFNVIAYVTDARNKPQLADDNLPNQGVRAVLSRLQEKLQTMGKLSGYDDALSVIEAFIKPEKVFSPSSSAARSAGLVSGGGGGAPDLSGLTEAERRRAARELYAARGRGTFVSARQAQEKAAEEAKAAAARREAEAAAAQQRARALREEQIRAVEQAARQKAEREAYLRAMEAEAAAAEAVRQAELARLAEVEAQAKAAAEAEALRAKTPPVVTEGDDTAAAEMPAEAAVTLDAANEELARAAAEMAAMRELEEAERQRAEQQLQQQRLQLLIQSEKEKQDIFRGEMTHLQAEAAVILAAMQSSLTTMADIVRPSDPVVAAVASLAAAASVAETSIFSDEVRLTMEEVSIRDNERRLVVLISALQARTAPEVVADSGVAQTDVGPFHTAAERLQTAAQGLLAEMQTLVSEYRTRLAEEARRAEAIELAARRAAEAEEAADATLDHLLASTGGTESTPPRHLDREESSSSSDSGDELGQLGRTGSSVRSIRGALRLGSAGSTRSVGGGLRSDSEAGLASTRSAGAQSFRSLFAGAGRDANSSPETGRSPKPSEYDPALDYALALGIGTKVARAAAPTTATATIASRFAAAPPRPPETDHGGDVIHIGDAAEAAATTESAKRGLTRAAARRVVPVTGSAVPPPPLPRSSANPMLAAAAVTKAQQEAARLLSLLQQAKTDYVEGVASEVNAWSAILTRALGESYTTDSPDNLKGALTALNTLTAEHDQRNQDFILAITAIETLNREQGNSRDGEILTLKTTRAKVERELIETVATQFPAVAAYLLKHLRDFNASAESTLRGYRDVSSLPDRDLAERVADLRKLQAAQGLVKTETEGLFSVLAEHADTTAIIEEGHTELRTIEARHGRIDSLIASAEAEQRRREELAELERLQQQIATINMQIHTLQGVLQTEVTRRKNLQGISRQTTELYGSLGTEISWPSLPTGRIDSVADAREMLRALSLYQDEMSRKDVTIRAQLTQFDQAASWEGVFATFASFIRPAAGAAAAGVGALTIQAQITPQVEAFRRSIVELRRLGMEIPSNAEIAERVAGLFQGRLDTRFVLPADATFLKAAVSRLFVRLRSEERTTPVALPATHGGAGAGARRRAHASAAASLPVQDWVDPNEIDHLIRFHVQTLTAVDEGTDGLDEIERTAVATGVVSELAASATGGDWWTRQAARHASRRERTGGGSFDDSLASAAAASGGAVVLNPGYGHGRGGGHARGASGDPGRTNPLAALARGRSLSAEGDERDPLVSLGIEADIFSAEAVAEAEADRVARAAGRGGSRVVATLNPAFAARGEDELRPATATAAAPAPVVAANPLHAAAAPLTLARGLSSASLSLRVGSDGSRGGASARSFINPLQAAAMPRELDNDKFLRGEPLTEDEVRAVSEKVAELADPTNGDVEELRRVLRFLAQRVAFVSPADTEAKLAGRNANYRAIRGIIEATTVAVDPLSGERSQVHVLSDQDRLLFNTQLAREKSRYDPPAVFPVMRAFMDGVLAANESAFAISARQRQRLRAVAAAAAPAVAGAVPVAGPVSEWPQADGTVGNVLHKRATISRLSSLTCLAMPSIMGDWAMWRTYRAMVDEVRADRNSAVSDWESKFGNPIENRRTKDAKIIDKKQAELAAARQAAAASTVAMNPVAAVARRGAEGGGAEPLLAGAGAGRRGSIIDPVTQLTTELEQLRAEEARQQSVEGTIRDIDLLGISALLAIYEEAHSHVWGYDKKKRSVLASQPLSALVDPDQLATLGDDAVAVGEAHTIAQAGVINTSGRILNPEGSVGERFANISARSRGAVPHPPERLRDYSFTPAVRSRVTHDFTTVFNALARRMLACRNPAQVEDFINVLQRYTMAGFAHFRTALQSSLTEYTGMLTEHTRMLTNRTHVPAEFIDRLNNLAAKLKKGLAELLLKQPLNTLINGVTGATPASPGAMTRLTSDRNTIAYSCLVGVGLGVVAGVAAAGVEIYKELHPDLPDIIFSIGGSFDADTGFATITDNVGGFGVGDEIYIDPTYGEFNLTQDASSGQWIIPEGFAIDPAHPDDPQHYLIVSSSQSQLNLPVAFNNAEVANDYSAPITVTHHGSHATFSVGVNDFDPNFTYDTLPNGNIAFIHNGGFPAGTKINFPITPGIDVSHLGPPNYHWIPGPNGGGTLVMLTPQGSPVEFPPNSSGYMVGVNIKISWLERAFYPTDGEYARQAAAHVTAGLHASAATHAAVGETPPVDIAQTHVAVGEAPSVDTAHDTAAVDSAALAATTPTTPTPQALTFEQLERARTAAFRQTYYPAWMSNVAAGVGVTLGLGLMGYSLASRIISIPQVCAIALAAYVAEKALIYPMIDHREQFEKAFSSWEGFKQGMCDAGGAVVAGVSSAWAKLCDGVTNLPQTFRAFGAATAHTFSSAENFQSATSRTFKGLLDIGRDYGYLLTGTAVIGSLLFLAASPVLALLMIPTGGLSMPVGQLVCDIIGAQITLGIRAWMHKDNIGPKEILHSLKEWFFLACEKLYGLGIVSAEVMQRFLAGMQNVFSRIAGGSEANFAGAETVAGVAAEQVERLNPEALVAEFSAKKAAEAADGAKKATVAKPEHVALPVASAAATTAAPVVAVEKPALQKSLFAGISEWWGGKKAEAPASPCATAFWSGTAVNGVIQPSGPAPQ